MKNKMLLSIIALLLVVLTLLGYTYEVSHSILPHAYKPENRSFLLTPTSLPQVTVWKTYTNTHYSLQYPPDLYIYEYDHPTTCIDISDIPNPKDFSLKISPKGHELITICSMNSPMPTSFPYQDGSSFNTTIKPFVINGYIGLQGREKNTMDDGTLTNPKELFLKQDLPDEDGVFLANPKGGYVSIFRQLGDKNVFHKILGTIKIQ